MPFWNKILLLVFFVGISLITIILVYKFKPVSLKDNNSKTLVNKNIPEKTNKNNFESTLSIDYIKSLKIESSAPVIESQLNSGVNYSRYIASYKSEGNKIYGLLAIPNSTIPEKGYPAIIFVHGYIPPKSYKTEEKYVSYVDSLAKAGFVVFKIDLRGHGNSEGVASGTYFSNGYTIDTLNAFSSLQKLEQVNKQNIGIWGHSMAGNIVLRTMLVNNNIKAGVIWAGAVYSYKDFAKYGLNDSSYVPNTNIPTPESKNANNIKIHEEILKFRANRNSVNFDNDFWNSISLTNNIKYLTKPILINHAIDDKVVNINYSKDLVEVLKQNNKEYEYNEYKTGGHNIEEPSYTPAMQRTIDFFKLYLD